MLMSSKFNSYCKICGRPIFEGDLFEYNRESKRGVCICCYVGYQDVELKCQHWAVSRYEKINKSSNRYKEYYFNIDSNYRCLICKADLDYIDNDSTIYIQKYITERHGRSPYTNSWIESFIQIGNYSRIDNPDKKSIEALQIIISDVSISNEIKDIAFSHIMRINNYINEYSLSIVNLSNSIKNNLDKVLYDYIYKNINLNNLMNKILKKKYIENFKIKILPHVTMLTILLEFMKDNSIEEDLIEDIFSFTNSIVEGVVKEYEAISTIVNIYLSIGMSVEFIDILKKLIWGKASKWNYLN